MNITLVGMSGMGKSFWANRLEQELGYSRICCDELIEKELSGELKAVGTRGLAEWLGLPGSPTYLEREARYLALEADVMGDAVKAASRITASPGVVIDTTGSAIYCDAKHFVDFRRLGPIVHLRATEDQRALLLDRFVRSPKPIIWSGCFNVLEGEEKTQTLSRCYAELLMQRLALYSSSATHEIGVDELRRLATAQQLLEQVRR